MVAGDCILRDTSPCFCSTLNYVCMRILGEGLFDGKENAWIRRRKWICDRGGVTFIHSWGKIFILHNIDAFYVLFKCGPVIISLQNNTEKKNQHQYLLLMPTTNYIHLFPFYFWKFLFIFFGGTVLSGSVFHMFPTQLD